MSSSGTLNAISCRSASSCVAVESVGATPNAPFELSQPLVLVGNPATWRVHDASQITLGGTFGYEGTLDEVGCVAATSCVAVGAVVVGH